MLSGCPEVPSRQAKSRASGDVGAAPLSAAHTMPSRGSGVVQDHFLTSGRDATTSAVS